MPTILDLFKQASANGEVTMWNGGAENKGLGGKIMDFVKAEINPKGPRVLFYKKLVTPPLIYGTETPRISLKGTVDPARTLALTSAKYIGDKDVIKKPPLLNLGSLMGGSANRPSDTIFESDSSAPVSRYSTPSSTGDWNALKYAVEKDKEYLISKVPMGPNALSGVLKGNLNQIGGKVVGAAVGAAKKAIGKAVQKAVTSKRRKNQAKPTGPEDKSNKAGTLYNNKKKHSQYFTQYDEITRASLDTKQRLNKSANDINAQLRNTPYFVNDTELRDTIDKEVQKTGTPYIKIKPYGKQYSMVFPATVTGLSESVTPEWNSFKYVGSPYNTYRYGGVERTLSFDFKLYYLDETEKYYMISNLNSLKELTFPYNELSTIKYADKDVALTYTPNLIELSIAGLYKNIFGFITQLEISVDETTSWSGNMNMESALSFGNELYPSVINVSFGMTIIENHQIAEGSAKNTKIFRYDFDGKEYYTVSMKSDGLAERDQEKLQKDIEASFAKAPIVMDDDIIPPPIIE